MSEPFDAQDELKLRPPRTIYEGLPPKSRRTQKTRKPTFSIPFTSGPFGAQGELKPRPPKETFMRLLPVLPVISAAKLRVRPDCRQIPCWLRFTAAQATLQTHNYKLGVLTHRQLSKGASYTTTKIM